MLWLLLFIPPFIIVPFLGDFLFQPGSPYSDLLISHFPNAVFIQHTIVQWHSLPLWSPTILSGYPFAANPLSGMWYLPGWLTVLLPNASGFNLAFILHLIWGGFGMYRFLKAEGLGMPAAIFGGLFFELLPKVWTHYAAGHITLVYALAWMPWLLLAEKGWLQKRPGKTQMPPGIVWGIVMLADIRWGAYAGVIWLGYRFWQRFICYPFSISTGDGQERIKEFLKRFGSFALFTGSQMILGLLIAAPLVLPLLQYSNLSTRSQMTSADVLAFSLPPGRLLGLIFPDWNGSAEWTCYASEIGLMLVILTLARKSIRSKVHFWLILLAGSLIYALGSAIPFMSDLAGTPGFDLLRVPARALFASGLCIVVIASTALDELAATGRVQLENGKLKPQMIISGLVEFMILLAGVIWFVQGSLTVPLIWGVLGGGLAAVFIVLRLRNQISGRTIGFIAVIFLLVDLGVIDRLSFEPRAPSSVAAGASQVVDYFTKDKGTFRIYSPSYSLPQDQAALSGLSLADGVDPLQLRSYTQFMQEATGVPFSGYSVTMPPFHSGNPSTDNQAYLPDLHQLGLLNVKYIVADFDINQPDLIFLAKYGETRIYENPFARPRAWVQTNPNGIDGELHPVKILSSSPNDFLAQASGPGLLVTSEIQYPGWQVRTDGVGQSLETVAGIFRGVKLSPGVHQVDFHFQPFPVYIGLILALCAWLSAAFIMIFLRRGSRDLQK